MTPAEVSYWDADGHWTEWRCDLPASPGLYRAADDEWTISDQGGLVQVITALTLVTQPEAQRDNPAAQERG